MTFLLQFLIVACVVCVSQSLVTGFRAAHQRLISDTRLYKVPLELSKDLDPTRSWEVKFIFEGVEKVAVVREDTSLLESGEQLFEDAPSSCRNGVCTTCAGKVS